eukprot:95080_1
MATVSVWHFLLLILCPFTLTFGCYYRNLTFHESTTLEPPGFDNCIIDSCTFSAIHGNGLNIKAVRNLTIKNSIFYNISGNAIHFKTGYYPSSIFVHHNQFRFIGWAALYVQNISNLQITSNIMIDIHGSNAITLRGSGHSYNVLINNNYIQNVYANGILAGENHKNLSIINNTIIHVGMDETSAANNAPHHGMYVQGAGFVIDQNIVYWVHNMNGNCISVRSFGTVSNNVLFNSTKRGITYYSDHAGYNGLLLIENNIIYNCPLNSIGISTNGDAHNHIGATIIRFNTCFMTHDNVPITVDDRVDWSSDVYCNILIRNGSTSFVSVHRWVNETHNLGGNPNDIAFVNVDMSDLITVNLHLLNSSNAIGFCNDLNTDYYSVTTYDIDGDRRGGEPRIDAGADQWTETSHTIDVEPTTTTNEHDVESTTANEHDTESTTTDDETDSADASKLYWFSWLVLIDVFFFAY